MKRFIFSIITIFLASPSGWARKAEPSVKLVPMAEIYAVTQHFGRQKIVVRGKEWDARKYCNEATMKNPSQLEFFSLKGRSEMVVLCPATPAGGENVISVFPKKGWPKERKVKATRGARVSDEVLRNSVIRLLKTSKR